jgi:hypothetical protein
MTSHTSNGCFTSPLVVVTQEDGSTVNLVVMKSLTLQTGAAITASGTAPLVLVSLADIAIDGGHIEAGSSLLLTGPGGAAPAGGVAAGGGTGGGVASAGAGIGPSGGSYCGLGGAGGGSTSTGKAYGLQGIRPLAGGSAGGGGEEGSGAGGGAIQLVAAGSITMAAGTYVDVGGQGGPIGGLVSSENAGGAGSGGSILLEAFSITVAGTLASNGGGGGGDYNSHPGDNGTPNATAAAGGKAGSSGGDRERWNRHGRRRPRCGRGRRRRGAHPDQLEDGHGDPDGGGAIAGSHDDLRGAGRAPDDRGRTLNGRLAS